VIQFNTANQSFRQIMGNGLKYKVPRFQRDYSWQETEWQDLWQDVTEVLKSGNKFHYMGYLVLQSSDNNNFTVIDVQQRLTTISTFILAVLYELKELINDKKEPEKNQKRLDALRNSFIGFIDPVSLQMEHKLSLNRNNNQHFQTYFCTLSEPPVRNINHSERLMGESLSYFRREIKNYYTQQINGEKLAQLIESMVDSLIFTAITVGNDINAYTVFETLNARGVQLSTPDLVKNYIFSLIDPRGDLHDEKIKNLEDKWSNIIEQLGRHKFSHFIRIDWNSRNDFSRKRELFKVIKTKLKDARSAEDYLGYLQRNSEIYSALQDESDEFWRRYEEGMYNKEQLRLSLKTLNLFNIVAPQSALIAGFHAFSPENFIKLLSYIEILSVRYNIICGKGMTFSQEKTYCETARDIMKNGSLDSALKILKKISPPDDEFLSAFAVKTFKTEQTHKKARFFLYRIEKLLSGSDTVIFDASSLGHILPKKPSEKWLQTLENQNDFESLVN